MPFWRQIQRENFTSIEKLCAFLELEPINSQNVIKKPSFALNLPKRLAEKMQKNNLKDPLFIQFVPTLDELDSKEGFSCDAVGDFAASLSPRYIKKYAARMLLITSSGCAVHCRYCFRRHYAYEGGQNFDQEIAWIKQDTTLREVILSGADPLSLSDRVLGDLIDRIASIQHIKRLRFHTRFPIGIPERIDESFLTLLKQCPLQTWFVIHCNHPHELDSDVLLALKKVQYLGIPILNQAVLLKGVNDNLETLQTLCEKLGDAGILFYYINQLDRVKGAHHFEVNQEKGAELIKALTERVSGYAVPKYVCEMPGMPSKQRVF